MSPRLPILATLALLAGGCIAPSVLDEGDRAVQTETQALVWSPADASDVPGTYVSTELTGPLAAAVRKLVYFFREQGDYAGTALIDDSPPRFELVGGTWSVGPEGLSLDGGPVALLEVAEDGSLRLTGAEGRVVLRRERER